MTIEKRIAKLEKKLAELEKQIQAQPMDIKKTLYNQVFKAISDILIDLNYFYKDLDNCDEQIAKQADLIKQVINKYVDAQLESYKILSDAKF